ncbi:MAG: class I SAM-dependent RNA methyltransferase [Acidobacteriota bacterium]
MMNSEADSRVVEQTLNVSIEKLVYGGEGLARTEQGVLLVPGVLPGESVEVELQPRQHGVRRGRLVRLVEPCQERVPPDCPYFAQCGGCQYQFIRYEEQLRLKQEILRECCERVGKFRLNVPVSVLADEPWHYRNRTRLRIENQSGRFEIGYFEPSSHRLCAIERCPISSPAINQVLKSLCDGVGASCFPEGKAEIELFASDSDQAILATVSSSLAPPRDFGEKLRSALTGVESVSWRQEPSGKKMVWGSGSITYHVGEFHYRVGHDSFFQVNRFLPDQMIRSVIADIEGARALDLYAGVGLFTVPLARRFQRVTAVEAQAAAARDLASNVGVAGARVRSYHRAVEKFIANTSPSWELILVNPPRNGLSKIVVEHLRRLHPRRFVYVSCDPTTLARDLAALIHSGYQIRSVHLVDQFPQTFHLESVIHLEHAG